MRSVDGGNAEILADSARSDNIVLITNMDLDMATAMSELMVNTTLGGSHVYTCNANLVVMPAPDVINGQADTTIVVQG